jgi:GNAT superfamily N-acetyltransferase
VLRRLLDLRHEGMGSELPIRQAMPEDAESVADILKEAARWLERSGMSLWQQDELNAVNIAEDVTLGLYFLAVDKGCAVGTLRFQLEDPTVWPDALPQQATYIHRLAVRRRYAGTGLSTILLRWAVDRTRALGRKYLRLDCVATRPRLRGVYESLDSISTAFTNLAPIE